MKLKQLLCLTIISLFSTHKIVSMSTEEIVRKLNDLDKRVTEIEEQVKPAEKKSFVKCTSKENCKKISKRKYKRLKSKPVDQSNKPATIAKCKNGHCRIFPRGRQQIQPWKHRHHGKHGRGLNKKRHVMGRKTMNQTMPS
jgi:hypothetical protein